MIHPPTIIMVVFSFVLRIHRVDQSKLSKTNINKSSIELELPFATMNFFLTLAWYCYAESHIYIKPICFQFTFLYPWKHRKTVRFSDVFRGKRKDALGTNGLRGTLPKRSLDPRKNLRWIVLKEIFPSQIFAGVLVNFAKWGNGKT